MSGAACTKETSCTVRVGMRIKKASRAAPPSTRNVTSMANHRGMMWESQRTGNESTSATAKPPSNTTGTVGENHMIRARRTSPSTTSTVRVRLEMRIGVGRNLPGSARVRFRERFLRVTAILQGGRAPVCRPCVSSSDASCRTLDQVWCCRTLDDPAQPVGAAAGIPSAYLEGRDQHQNAERHGVNADKPYQREYRGKRAYHDQDHPEEHGERAADDEGPLAPDLPSQPEGRRYFEDPREDGPRGDEVEKEERGQPRQHKGDEAGQDAGYPLDEQQPAGRPPAGATEDAHDREDAVDQGVGAEQQDQGLQGYPRPQQRGQPEEYGYAAAYGQSPPVSGLRRQRRLWLGHPFLLFVTAIQQTHYMHGFRATIRWRGGQSLEPQRFASRGGSRTALADSPIADGVSASPFGPVEGRVCGVGQFLVGGAVLGVAGDSYGDSRRGGYVVSFEDLCFDAAAYLLCYIHGLLFGEVGEDGLVLVAPETCGAAPLHFVHGADDVPDLTDDELAEQVPVGVVNLLEAVDVGHEHTQGSSLVGHRLEAVLELAVETPLGEEAREMVAVHEAVQLLVEGGFDLILVRELEHGVAHVYTVPIGQEMAAPRLLHDLTVERDGLLRLYAPHRVAAGFPVELGVPRFDLHVAHHDVGRKWVAA